MKEELLDVLDENGIKTGQILPRKEVHEKGLWHRIIVVAIVNEKNEILIQQRSHNKDKNPDMWDISVTGHLSAGQDSLTAATRKEQKVSDKHYDRQFYDFFILRQSGLREENIKFQSSEVQAIKFVTISELNEMRENNLLVERDECYDALSEYLFRI